MAYIMENDVTDTSVASAHTWVLNRYPTITNEDYVAPANSAMAMIIINRVRTTLTPSPNA